MRADLAAWRVAWLWEVWATEVRAVVLVAGPKRRSSQARMVSDQEPRGSLGSQKP